MTHIRSKIAGIGHLRIKSRDRQLARLYPVKLQGNKSITALPVRYVGKEIVPSGKRSSGSGRRWMTSACAPLCSRMCETSPA